MNLLGTFVVVLISLSLLESNAQRFFPRFNLTESGGVSGLLPVASVLPTPNGPFYGMPFDLISTMSRYLPFTISGSCETGQIFRITKGADLLNYKSDLECVYSAGIVPQKVPEGSFYGTVLSLINTQLFNSAVSQVWKGKMITKIPCNGNETYVGFNNVAGSPLVPFIASIGPVDLNLAPREHYDGKDALIIDYTPDFRQACPDYLTFLQNNYGNAVIRRRTLTGVYPMNQMVDAFRLVGKQEDGGSIYLGKTYLRDFYRTDLQAATVAYWYIVNHDETANPRLQGGEDLPPLKNSFKYMLPGTVDFALRLLPIDNLITTPVRTVGKLVKSAINSGRNSLLYARELVTGIRSSRVNRRIFQNSFNSQRNQIGLIDTTRNNNGIMGMLF